MQKPGYQGTFLLLLGEGIERVCPPGAEEARHAANGGCVYVVAVLVAISNARPKGGIPRRRALSEAAFEAAAGVQSPEESIWGTTSGGACHWLRGRILQGCV